MTATALYRALAGFVWIALLGSMSGCYVSRLALYQNNLFNGRRPLGQVISDPQTGPVERERLLWVQDVLAFATAENLNTEDSYRYYVDVPGGVISYTVGACPPFSLKQNTWWFPFTGSVPYLGFFEKEDRDRKAAELRREGLDVASGTVAGFSSLGWFEDPVYSPMLKKDKADLAHLLLHELTHRTVWIKGSVEFNEQLAEFAGEELTRKLLQQRGMTRELADFDRRQRDEARFGDWIRGLKNALGELYGTFGAAPPEDALRRKQEVIQKWTKEKLPKFESTDFDFVANKAWNNASILGAQLYAPDRNRFLDALKCTPAKRVGDWLRIWDDAIESPKDPLDQVLKRCS